MDSADTSTLGEIAQWATVVGVPLLLVQLFFTRRTAQSAAKEARGTRTAIERTEKQLANNHLLVRASEMDRIRERLDAARRDEKPAEATQILREWPTLANDSVAILDLLDSDQHAETITLLKTSMRAASEAKDRLIGQNASVEEATSNSRDLIEQACGAVTGVASTLKFTRSEHD